MFKNRFLLGGIFLAVCFANSFSQSKKDVRKYGIKSVTEMMTEIDNGKEVTFKSSFTSFDKNGFVAKKTDYHRDGTVKKEVTSKYDGYGNKIEDLECDGSRSPVSRQVFTYDKKALKAERREYNGSRVLVSIKKYQYQF